MKNQVVKIIEESVKKAGFKIPESFSVEEPPKGTKGDWATNIALIIAGVAKKNPKEVAEAIKSELEYSSDIKRVELAGPGFLNITLKNELYLAELAKILREKESYGKSSVYQGKKVNVEYVSANPTGPLHIGNARSGPLGEALANLFTFAGGKIEREFYVNDIGVQIGRFRDSLLYWFHVKLNPDLEFPKDGYPGEYIKIASEKIQEQFSDEIADLKDDELKEFFAKEGLKIMVEGIKNDLMLLGIEYDKWSYESDVVESGKPREIVKKLEEKGCTAEKDGAVWFKRPDDPDLEDKESVLIKSDDNKTLTYFADDIAYHIDKLGRNDLIVDVWGANHFVHIPRIKSALSALGYSSDKIDIIVYQYVRLKKSGVSLSMGKRLGNFVTLRAVIEAGVAPDAFKYFILSQNANTPFDFDIELAADTSEKNPVFYIKYAHARICSILEKVEGGAEGMEAANLSLLKDEKEIALYKELVKFPELIEEITGSFQIQAIPHFAYKIATLFHDFYNTCKVIGGEKELGKARLALIISTKYVISNALGILGIEAPEKM